MNSESNFILKGYEDLELSTQIIIRAALARGIAVEILERVSNFIRLSRDGHSCIIKEATRTHKDSLIAHFVMENKSVTKTLLAEAGLKVPPGESFSSVTKAGKFARELLKQGQIVIKPNTTNYGLSVFLLKPGESPTAPLYEAFQHSPTLIVEEYMPGDEMRFLVVGGQTIAVCKRLPANIQGDGTLTIEELVAQKNQHPKRGKNHKTPLEKIKLGPAELKHLEQQGMSPDTRPPAGERIYLRWNSNISTGGDSIDVTDNIPDNLKRKAEQAATALSAQICGVDMIISEDAQTYSILEANFNPVLYIHNYPLEGKNQQVGEKILDLLDFRKK